MKANLVHPTTKQIKQVKVGFSWTTLFFGFFPALFRGDWKWALIMLGAALITFGLSPLVFMFIYNKLYINDLLAAGFVPADATSETVLASKGFIFGQVEHDMSMNE